MGDAKIQIFEVLASLLSTKPTQTHFSISFLVIFLLVSLVTFQTQFVQTVFLYYPHICTLLFLAFPCSLFPISNGLSNFIIIFLKKLWNQSVFPFYFYGNNWDIPYKIIEHLLCVRHWARDTKIYKVIELYSSRKQVTSATNVMREESMHSVSWESRVQRWENNCYCRRDWNWIIKCVGDICLYTAN